VNNKVTLLITILFDDELAKVALKFERDKVSSQVLEYPLMRASRQTLHAMLPPHIQSMGKIVDVETIFDLVDKTP
jgi:hypothetical protein